MLNNHFSFSSWSNLAPLPANPLAKIGVVILFSNITESFNVVEPDTNKFDVNRASPVTSNVYKGEV